MNLELLPLALALGTTGALLLLGFVAGSIAERRHYQSIHQREAELRRLPAITCRRVPAGWSAGHSALVSGSVVISLDYFKRFLSGWRNLFGGPLRSYESLLDRARREAVLRMKEEARRLGFDAVLNVRLETCSISSAREDGKGVAGIEVVAFGTALAVAELR